MAHEVKGMLATYKNGLSKGDLNHARLSELGLRLELDSGIILA